jgi:hypothetical protein
MLQRIDPRAGGARAAAMRARVVAFVELSLVTWGSGYLARIAVTGRT